ncbi:SGNH/GDSL hydrolase family protein [Azomonas macrocytogenes]|uniref:Lysophospholipase L1-like esterase n=1 Tax=Azomonas macrocytogenes TaxID=69962 RepID=A0A839SYQ8_AZOMA|nr:SGNH/GDSL hydrolase family protein [Azomonas macrocytogenes]MBB3102018.1 lysophospholipase L1-like esterase [Azomonas macrocytogenes]
MKTVSKGSAATLLTFALAAQTAAAESTWVTSWTASPQPVWGLDFLFPTHAPAVLRDQTVRQVARLSLGGSRLRLVLSNAYGERPLTVGGATVALSGAPTTTVANHLRSVTFGGQTSATIAPGAPLLSDPVELPVPTLAQVTVSLYLPSETPVSTFHWDGRQTAWIVPGDQTSAPELDTAQDQAQSTTTRLLLSGIEIEAAPSAQAVAVIGDSITDGATASLDTDSRWPDFLATRLAPHGVAVINAGISGSRQLSDGMGVNALARLERDVLAQPGVRSVVVLLGINDIAWPGTAFARQTAQPALDALVAGYRQLIERARSRGLRVIGATLTPFAGALPDTPLDDYWNPDKDALRQQVNIWIRDSGAFDAVIDFDAVTRDPANLAQLDPRFDSGDHLHPGDAGNHAMAESINLDDLLPGLAARSVTSQEH